MLKIIKNPLYHGTIYKIDKIDVSKGRDHKDFGKGFYLAVTKSQAIGMMHKKYNEAIRRLRNKKDACISEYLYEAILDETIISDLNIKVFEIADIEWLDFVLECREKGGVPHSYDIVVGPTADDDTLLCLRTYWDGLYGNVGSQLAKEVLLNNLEPENLGVQLFIGKQSVMDKIIKSFKEINHK